MDSNFTITKEPPSWWNDYVNWPRQTSHFCELNSTSQYFIMKDKGLCFQILKKGPFSMAKSFFPEIDEELLTNFKKYCKENKLKLLIHAYKELPNLKPVMLATAMVNLKNDNLWMSLDKKQRNRIRRAKEKNLKFKEAQTKQEWLEYYKLYKETSTRKNIKFYPEEYLDSLFNLDRDYSKLFYVEYQNKPISYAQVFIHKKIIFLNSLANTEKSYEINANAYLLWKTI
ncbi:MAG: peptidoglycan bridge formation glycyltransferase FemA/FemB family protein, partial [Nanoarchaeota archaeon]